MNIKNEINLNMSSDDLLRSIQTLIKEGNQQISDDMSLRFGTLESSIAEIKSGTQQQLTQFSLRMDAIDTNTNELQN